MWASAKGGAHAVSGYLEETGRGSSIRYEVEIEGTADSIIVRFAGEVLAQSGPLSGERVRSGYLYSIDSPDEESPVFRDPRGTRLVVIFKDGTELSAKLTPEPRK